DVNGDGKMDLAFAAPVGNAIGVVLGTGTGAFGNESLVSVPAGSNPAYLAAADLNGDGKLDLVTANQGNDTVSVLLGNGSGGFSPSTALTTGNSPRNLVIGDINNDRLPDVVVSNGLANTLSVFTQRCQ
ncbi:MAG: VCBS repeat-containing protein, partial [Myxococcales bacterium]|nr:VCBS repeat-containing protein [Myxococcales bacterium]